MVYACVHGCLHDSVFDCVRRHLFSKLPTCVFANLCVCQFVCSAYRCVYVSMHMSVCISALSECHVNQPSVVQVFKGNITAHPVDAIVNAANSKLWHSGGVAEHICRAAGHSFQTMCNAVVAALPNLAVGDCVVTDAGELECSKVIHAVGPNFASKFVWLKPSSTCSHASSVADDAGLSLQLHCRLRCCSQYKLEADTATEKQPLQAACAIITAHAHSCSPWPAIQALDAVMMLYLLQFTTCNSKQCCYCCMQAIVVCAQSRQGCVCCRRNRQRTRALAQGSEISSAGGFGPADIFPGYALD